MCRSKQSIAVIVLALLAVSAAACSTPDAVHCGGPLVPINGHGIHPELVEAHEGRH